MKLQKVGATSNEPTARSVLVKARELLSDPGHWTQGGFAKLKSGDLVHSRHNEAVCWCLAGAVAACSGDPWEDADVKARRGALSALLKELHAPIDLRDEAPDPIFTFNDAPERTYEEVLELLDRAIASC